MEKARHNEAMNELPSVDDLIRYVIRYKPDYQQTIRGASDAEIAELEQLVGRELPPHYRQYLERMGHNDGGLEFGQGGYTDVAPIIQLYRESISTDEIEIPPNCLAISWGGVGVSFDEICLEFGPPENARVLFTGADEVLALYAATFTGLLFRMAFETFQVNAFPQSKRYISEDDQRQVEQAGRFAEQLGFVRRWFSDDIAFCGEQQDGSAAIFVNQFEGMGMSVKIAANDAGMLKRVGGAFVGELRLKQHWGSTLAKWF